MADVRVSTAETLDAFRTAELVGWRDREALKSALALTLPKTEDEKAAFDACFDQYFRFDDFQSTDEQAEANAEADEGDDPDAGNSDEGGGDGNAAGEARAGGGGGQGQPGEPDADSDSELEALVQPGQISEPNSALGQLLMDEDKTRLSMAIADAAQDVQLEEIKVFTQKGLYTRRMLESMGLGDLQTELRELEQSDQLPDRRLEGSLRRRLDGLREQVRDHVERQFLLHADARGDRLRQDMLRRVKLSNVEQRNFRHLRLLVQKMARQLVAAHSRRRRVTKRGQLHVPKTLRHNLRHNGDLVDLKWKSTRIDRPKVFAVCDVSGSVANYARFMLMFLYSLEEVIPNVRAFAFSSDLGEVTDLFKRLELEDAINATLRDYSGGSTDYGQAFEDFERLAGSQLDSRSTLIILGDARNNHGEPRSDLLRLFRDRSRRVIWLNPEPARAWGSGDSEMLRYQAHVHQVAVCNSLMHLQRIVSDLLRNVS